MTAGGWIAMIASLAFVWGLTGWCFYRVLTAPAEDEVERSSAIGYRSTDDR